MLYLLSLAERVLKAKILTKRCADSMFYFCKCFLREICLYDHVGGFMFLGQKFIQTKWCRVGRHLAKSKVLDQGAPNFTKSSNLVPARPVHWLSRSPGPVQWLSKPGQTWPVAIQEFRTFPVAVQQGKSFLVMHKSAVTAHIVENRNTMCSNKS